MYLSSLLLIATITAVNAAIEVPKFGGCLNRTLYDEGDPDNLAFTCHMASAQCVDIENSEWLTPDEVTAQGFGPCSCDEEYSENAHLATCYDAPATRSLTCVFEAAECPAAWIPLGNRYNNANEIDSECGHNSAAFGGRGDGPICGKRCTCNFAYTSGSNPMLAGSTTYGVCKDPTANTEHCAVDKLACDSGDSFTPAIQDTDGKCTCLNTPTGACLDASGDFLHCAVLADSCSSGTTFSSAKQFLATGGTTKCNLCVDTWNVAFCFSGMATVETLDGVVNMKDLKVGDKVKIGQSTFDEVYMFGHHAPQEKARFVAVHTSSKSTTRPLELSRDHMIFMADGNAVPAGILKKGDEILLGNGQTTKITKVTQINSEGVFAPFTRSGKIVVNNVLASSYVTLQRDSGFVTMGAIKTPITHQAVSHTFMTPLRILSWFVSLEQYNDVGLNLWLAYPMRIANWWLDIKNMLFQAVLFFPFGAYMLLANSWCVALCLLMLVSRKSNVNVRLGSAAAGDAALKKSQ